jgi:GTP-binding protein
MNNKKGLVVFVNKWDIIKDKSKESIKYFENTILSRTAPFTDYPILFGSALTNKNIFKVLQAAYEVYDKKQKLVGTSKLNETMLPLIEAYPPPSMKGKYIKIKYCSQLPNTSVPTFVFYANLPQYIKEPYIRFLENKIREKWDFKGTPIRILINQK